MDQSTQRAKPSFSRSSVMLPFCHRGNQKRTINETESLNLNVRFTNGCHLLSPLPDEGWFPVWSDWGSSPGWSERLSAEDGTQWRTWPPLRMAPVSLYHPLPAWTWDTEGERKRTLTQSSSFNQWAFSQPLGNMIKSVQSKGSTHSFLLQVPAVNQSLQEGFCAKELSI